MATSDRRIIAICHTPESSDQGAEAGVWTHPDFRGRGHAATVTAAWATLMGPTGKVLFYSTSRTNLSSQRVADRLGLPLIGWLWQIASPDQ
ncbi:MAG TPA: GNAT family N-acetyltransferase [Actinomycetota bacterium]|nr:GNAT family N-acetyltransferase [Actinomycetota bacterium]